MRCSPNMDLYYYDSRNYMSTLEGTGTMEKIIDVVEKVVRKPYFSPVIIHELELETRAGSPLGLPELFDLGDE
jgi:hypothetical protein